MLNMINQYASVCILNKKDKPLICKKEIEAIMDEKKIDNNGHPYVDLCLPSKTLWSTMNVGASKPSEYGLLFQWGDTQGWATEQVGFGEGKKKFLYDDYKWAIKESLLTFSKYTTPGASLELEDDAANANMGGDWHMPSPEQIQELIDNTTNKWTILDRIKGVEFTSKKDSSKSIFIPAAGFAWNGLVVDTGNCGILWASELSINAIYYGKYLYFNSEHTKLSDGFRNDGLSVRGVIG